MQQKGVGGEAGFGSSHAGVASQKVPQSMANVLEEAPVAEASRVETAAPRKRTGVKHLVLLVVLLAVAAASGAAYFHFRDRVSSDDAQVDGHISAVAPKITGNVVEVMVK